MAEKSAERIEFLSDILGEVTGAGSYGFFYLIEETGQGTAEHKARIIDKEDACDDDGWPLEVIPEDKIVTVDLGTIARGLGVIQRSVMRDTPEVIRTVNAGTPDEMTYTIRSENVLHNVRTGERLYMSPQQKKAIRDASFENEAADLDILDYLAILECGLFGKVMYA